MEDNCDARFACDAMLGSLARWLRAAGYDAFWREGIDDWELVRLAQREQRILLTSDTGICRIGIVRDGDLLSLFIKPGLGKEDQLALVLRSFKLPLREPCCMSCGGAFAEVPRDAVRERVPPRSWSWVQRFFECTRCGRIFWQGTHWKHIASCLGDIDRRAAAPHSG
jgi:uncharacterized protein with PIN domain